MTGVWKNLITLLLGKLCQHDLSIRHFKKKMCSRNTMFDAHKTGEGKEVGLTLFFFKMKLLDQRRALMHFGEKLLERFFACLSGKMVESLG